MLCASKLKRVLVGDAIVVPSVDRGDEFVLREVDAGRTIMAVTVVGDSAELIGIRMSTDSRRIGLLRNVRGKWNLIFDYILFGMVGSTWHAVLVEMKKTATESTHPREQLRWSLPVLDYIRQTCELEFEQAIIRPKVSYAILSEKLHERVDKRIIRGAYVPFDPESWKGITIRSFVGTRVRFRDLIG